MPSAQVTVGSTNSTKAKLDAPATDWASLTPANVKSLTMVANFLEKKLLPKPNLRKKSKALIIWSVNEWVLLQPVMAKRVLREAYG